MATFYGSDTSCVYDVGLIDVQVTDPKILIGQRIARLLQTPRGALGIINDDPNRGFSVRVYVNAKLSPSDIATAQTQIQNEVLKDEEVSTCVCSLSLANGAVTIGLSVLSAAGPFSLTLNVSQLTTTLIFNF